MQILLAGTNNGVFLSVNDGDTWTSLNIGLPETRGFTNIDCIGTNETSIFAGLRTGEALNICGLWQFPLNAIEVIST